MFAKLADLKIGDHLYSISMVRPIKMNPDNKSALLMSPSLTVDHFVIGSMTSVLDGVHVVDADGGDRGLITVRDGYLMNHWSSQLYAYEQLTLLNNLLRACNEGILSNLQSVLAFVEHIKDRENDFAQANAKYEQLKKGPAF